MKLGDLPKRWVVMISVVAKEDKSYQVKSLIYLNISYVYNISYLNNYSIEGKFTEPFSMIHGT